MNSNSEAEKRKLLKRVRRAVIKVGSSVLTGGGDLLNQSVFAELASSVAGLRKRGVEIVMVSSGAVAAGRRYLSCVTHPSTIPQKQAAAAIGQVRLMWFYEESFTVHGYGTAQVLLTRDALSDRHKFLNARNTLFTLLKCNIIPIINENDSVTVDEIKFGDNDILSALVTNLVDADLLLILTDRDGLCSRDPALCETVEPISIVETVDSSIEDIAGGSSGPQGTGGMASKVDAAKKASFFGIPTMVVNGMREGIIAKVFSGTAVGTLFLPRKTRLSSRKHWIAFNLKPKGTLVVDDGARKAVVNGGKSLLPSGLVEVKGYFDFGDPVICAGTDGEEFARGLVNYRAEELIKIKGLHSREIKKALGYKYYDEIIHRDDLVVLEDTNHE